MQALALPPPRPVRAQHKAPTGSSGPLDPGIQNHEPNKPVFISILLEQQQVERDPVLSRESQGVCEGEVASVEQAGRRVCETQPEAGESWEFQPDAGTLFIEMNFKL